jgi:hypothetical protein
MLNQSVLDRAHDFAERGLSVIRLKPCSKKPQGGWKTFQQRHATDAELVRWFGSAGDSPPNIGLVTGRISGVVVVDTDSAEAEVWAKTSLPVTEMMTETAKGFHRFYRDPGFHVGNKVHAGGLKLDLKADHGYVVGPGSVHETGVIYEARGSWPAVSELPVFDPEWFDRFAAPATIDRRLSAERRAEVVRLSSGLRTPVPYLSPILISSLPDTLSEFVLPPEYERLPPGTDDPAQAARRAKAKRAGQARWAKDLDRFQRLRAMRGGFSEGIRSKAVLIGAYLFRHDGWTPENVETAARLLARECHPPLSEQETRHQIESAYTRLKMNLRRETIDAWLRITPEEREVLDPNEHARALRAVGRQAVTEALLGAIQLHTGLSHRKLAEHLKRQGVDVSYSTVARWRKTIPQSVAEHVAMSAAFDSVDWPAVA